MKKQESVSDFVRRIGRKGGRATKKTLGKKHFSEAGKKGAAARWNKKQ